MQNLKVELKKFSDKIFLMKSISKKTVENHLKLYQGYINKYNEIIEKLNKLTKDDYTNGNQVYSTIRELKVELSFAWGGIINHKIYFDHLGGKGGKPSGDLLKQIEKDFGSFENYLRDVRATAMAARGWVWTGWNQIEERLFNYLGDAQNSYLVWGVTPLLALDTYEHAYFADFGTDRASYVDAFFKNIDWKKIQNNFEEACCSGDGECRCNQ